VHGEREIVPSAAKAEAAKALRRFTAGYDKAYREGDPAVIAGVETGALQTMNRAGLEAQRATMPDGNPDYAPVALRTVDGGAPMFFAAHHAEKRTMAQGYRIGKKHRRHREGTDDR
jgi:hypothetical protein